MSQRTRPRRQLPRRWSTLALIAVVASVLAAPVQARAAVASATPGAAQVVTVGPWQHGTADVSSHRASPVEFWRVGPVLKGDVLTIDAVAEFASNDVVDQVRFCLLPAAAFDAAWAYLPGIVSAAGVVCPSSSLARNDTLQVGEGGALAATARYTALDAGAQLLVVAGSTVGAPSGYGFRVRSHQRTPVLRIDAPARPARAGRLTGSATTILGSPVCAAAASGARFSLYARVLGGAARRVGTGTIVRAGVVSYTYAMPRSLWGRQVVLWSAASTNAQFLAATSKSLARTLR